MSEPLTVRTEAGDEHLDLADFEARVRKGEISPQSLVCFPAVTGGRFVSACELDLFQRLHEPKRAHFARAFSLARFPWMTAAIIFANLIVYAVCVQDGPVDIDTMVQFGAKVGPLITDLGEFWRLFTANFVHRDAMHIGLNMFVLFNVGGALENTYRKLDYLWLLVFAGVATMTVSLFLSDAVSLGASGMVYGCLGGVVVFGLKYRSILPTPYRRIMGEAAIPTVIGLLLIGLTSAGVDNWAHFGGLVAGMTASLFIRPRLLADTPRSPWFAAMRALPSALLLCIVLAGPALFSQWLPWLRVERDDGYGVSVPVPRDWRRGANRLGRLAYYNGLPGLGRATFAAEAITVGEPADAEAHARRFAEESLRPQAIGPEVLRVSALSPEPARIADRDAVMLKATFAEPFGSTRLVAYFVPRGELLYQLVFTYPDAYPAYAHVVDQMVSGMRFEEPKALREARARALLFPNAPWALGALGETLRRLGEPSGAADALQVAVQQQPSNASFRVELALALLQLGQLDPGCRAAESALLYAPGDARALEARARCELQRGDYTRALEFLQQARAANPSDERLRQVEGRLRTAMTAQVR